MKIWGNKVLAENNKVKKDNGMASKSNNFFYILNKKYLLGVLGGVADRLSCNLAEKMQSADEGAFETQCLQIVSSNFF